MHHSFICWEEKMRIAAVAQLVERRLVNRMSCLRDNVAGKRLLTAEGSTEPLGRHV